MSHSRSTELISVAATADDPRPLQRKWLRVFALFLAMALIAILAGTVSGQGPKFDVINIDPKYDTPAIEKQVSKQAASYAMASDLAQVPKARSGAAGFYFSQYLPAKLTQPSSQHEISEVMNQANALLDRAVRSRRPSARNIMGWMYNALKPIAEGNYQPAARINAIQFISKLAKASEQRGAPPVPYPRVFTDLMPIYVDETAPEGVRAAALHGIERFVRYTPTDQVDAAAKTQVTTEMKKLLAEEAPKGRDPLVHAYLQRYAVSILTNLDSEPTLGVQLVTVSTDEKKPDLIALHSAASIGALRTKLKQEDFKTEEILKQWTNRVLKSFESEVARLDAIEGKASTSGVTQPQEPRYFLEAKEKEEDEEKTQTAATAAGMDMGMGTMDMGEMGGGMDMDMDMMGGMMEMGGGSMAGGFGMGAQIQKVQQPAEVVASRKKLNHTIQSLWMGATGTRSSVEDLEELKPAGGIMVATGENELPLVKKWLETIDTVAKAINEGSISQTNSYRKVVNDQIEVLNDYLEGKDDEAKPDTGVPVFEQFGQFNP